MSASGRFQPLARLYTERLVITLSSRSKMTPIEITGWRNGADKVGADKLLAHDAGLGLSSGKSLIDDVVAGRVTEFEVADDQLAERIINTLRDLGFDARMKQ